MTRFYANGKFLLTAEYLVMKGAKALALPLKFGQEMLVSNQGNQEDLLHWVSKENGQIWFEAEFQKSDFSIVSSSDSPVAEKLRNILTTFKKQVPQFLSESSENRVETNINFNRNWGLGSSSTLLNLIAKWSGGNAYRVLKETFGGSGYDLACAEASGPIFYKIKPEGNHVQEADFHPEFAHQLYFVYSGKKQNSGNQIARFDQNAAYSETDILEISRISEQFCEAKSAKELIELCDLHESMISRILKYPTLKSSSFPDFAGTVKSMGAWGGDFFLAISELPKNEVKNYFTQKGLNTIFDYSEMALNSETIQSEPIKI